MSDRAEITERTKSYQIEVCFDEDSNPMDLVDLTIFDSDEQLQEYLDMKLIQQEALIVSIYEQIDSLEPHQIDESQETIESMIEELWPFVQKIRR